MGVDIFVHHMNDGQLFGIGEMTECTMVILTDPIWVDPYLYIFMANVILAIIPPLFVHGGIKVFLHVREFYSRPPPFFPLLFHY